LSLKRALAKITVIIGDCGLKMAVPAQEERHRGAIPASELARAGAINVRAADDVSCDRLTFGLPTHILNASHYTPLV
jgi:hypothetical protein